MGRLDRREKTALDEAYRLFRTISHEDTAPDLYQLVRCLKTIENALIGAREGQLTLTVRLWQRIREALFDKLFTSFSAYVVIYTPDDNVLEPKKPIPEGAIVEIRPEGLRRADDAFSMEIEHLHPDTRSALHKVWMERGNWTKRDDFLNFGCTEMCAPKLFVIGEEILQNETEVGKEKAYKQWWDLYWQAYCTDDQEQRKFINQRMESLESVWGNLYY